MNHPFPLLLKLAAIAAASTLVVFSFRRHRRFTALQSLRRNILHSLVHLPGNIDGVAAPPVILILGFWGHGKSAFVNMACRALAGEEGLMVLRSETAEVGLSTATATATRLVLRVVASAGCDCDDWVEDMEEEMVAGEGLAVDFIDAPSFPEPATMTAAHVEAALAAAAAAVEAGGGRTSVAQPPECVVMVLKCNRTVRECQLAVSRLAEIADVVKNKGWINEDLHRYHLMNHVLHIQVLKFYYFINVTLFNI